MVDYSKRNFLKTSALAGAEVLAAAAFPGRIKAETKPLTTEKIPLKERFNDQNVAIKNVRYKRYPEDHTHERRALTLDLTPLLGAKGGFRGQIIVYGYNHFKGEGGAAANYIVREEVNLWDSDLIKNSVFPNGGDLEIEENGAKTQKTPSGTIFFPITHPVREASKEPDNTGLQVIELDPDYDCFAIFVLESKAESATRLNEQGFFDTVWEIKSKDAVGILIDNKTGRKIDTGERDKTLDTIEAFYQKSLSTEKADSFING